MLSYHKVMKPAFGIFFLFLKCIFQFGDLSDLSGSDKRQRTDSMASSDQVPYRLWCARCSVVNSNPDPHHFGNLDPDPHQHLH